MLCALFKKNLNNGRKEYMCGRRVVAPRYQLVVCIRDGFGLRLVLGNL